MSNQAETMTEQDWDERFLSKFETRNATIAITAVLGVAAVWLVGVIIMAAVR